MRADAIHIYRKTVEASLPGDAVFHHLASSIQRLRRARKIYVLAVGKAAESMCEGAHRFLSSYNLKIVRSTIVVPKGTAATIDSAQIFFAGHPLPDEQSILAAQTVLSEIGSLGAEDLILLLLSGGGSALFELPEEGITLAELQKWYRELIESGLSITEVNALRHARSRVKGGKLARATDAGIIQLLLSDVPGDDPAVIASGPGYAPELAHRIETRIIGSAAMALDIAAGVAQTLGYRALSLTSVLEGNAAQKGEEIAMLCSDLLTVGLDQPIALLAAGETTVHVTGMGRGGRNMHLALAAALCLDRLCPDSKICIASLGTDGVDGPTDAAGGIVDSTTARRIRGAGMDPVIALEDCNSYGALDAVGDLHQCGYTGTNVNDLMIALIQAGRALPERNHV